MNTAKQDWQDTVSLAHGNISESNEVLGSATKNLILVTGPELRIHELPMACHHMLHTVLVLNIEEL